MRFMTIVKSSEAAGPPPQALMDAIAKLGEEEEALKWARRFMELHKEHWKGWEGECELRQLFG
jgi:hypothetical protein